jgi:hypothetical protein
VPTDPRHDGPARGQAEKLASVHTIDPRRAVANPGWHNYRLSVDTRAEGISTLALRYRDNALVYATHAALEHLHRRARTPAHLP